MKQCGKCGEHKCLTLFHADKHKKDGKQSYCKECKKANREENKEAIAAQKAQYYQENKDAVAARMAQYYQENKEAFAAHAAKRRAIKLQRTPHWLTEAHYSEIKEIYTSCPEGHHVDHIVPLQGENVSGLHVPWNLQHLTAEENLIKGNKLVKEYL